MNVLDRAPDLKPLSQSIGDIFKDRPRKVTFELMGAQRKHRCPTCLREFQVAPNEIKNCPQCGTQCVTPNNGVLMRGRKPDSYHGADEMAAIGVFEVKGGWQFWVYRGTTAIAKGDIEGSRDAAIDAASRLINWVRGGLYFDESIVSEKTQ